MNTIRVMIGCMMLLALTGWVSADDVKPGSAVKTVTPQDKMKIDKLLKGFDPHSYHIRYATKDAQGKVVIVEAGLADVRQVNTVRTSGHADAGTNTIITIFKTNDNSANAKELNAILQKYAN